MTERIKQGCVVLLAMAMVAVCGCETIAPVRTLPAWVRGVHVPMIRNSSFEPGLEEYATRATQEAFLEDGRLDIVPLRQADLKVVAEIVEWRERARGTSGDEVTSDRGITLVANVALYEPFNDEVPLATLPPVVVSNKFNIDARSTDFDTEPERRARLMQALGRAIVAQTITGFPVELNQQRELRTLPRIRSANDLGGPDLPPPATAP